MRKNGLTGLSAGLGCGKKKGKEGVGRLWLGFWAGLVFSFFGFFLPLFFSKQHSTNLNSNVNSNLNSNPMHSTK